MKTEFEEAFANVRFNPSINKEDVVLYYDNGFQLIPVKLSQIQGKIEDLLLIEKRPGDVVEIPTHRVRVIRYRDQLLLDRRSSYKGDPRLPDSTL